MCYHGATLFKPNLKELKEGLKLDFDQSSEKELAKAVDMLKSKLKIDLAMITLSEHGIYIHGRHVKKDYQRTTAIFLMFRERVIPW